VAQVSTFDRLAKLEVYPLVSYNLPKNTTRPNLTLRL